MRYIMIALETEDDKLIELYVQRIDMMVRHWNKARGLGKMSVMFDKQEISTVYHKAINPLTEV